ncbi:hypothetical protein PIB30_034205 [Stylosanthes scabra]|uniref:Uncharacterized protein n=1 Tax=Stylosanthes scabra TaxID=79078 RepID=A0ABU6SCX2_9FABA|nr:hypothetical protein [Stylosanthes scabra]
MSDEVWEELDLRAASTIRLCLAKNVLANIQVNELEAIGVKIDDEDKALRLILLLPLSFEYITPVLMYGKATLSFSEVASKVISEERRLKCESRATDSVLVVTKNERGGRRDWTYKEILFRWSKFGKRLRIRR